MCQYLDCKFKGRDRKRREEEKNAILLEEKIDKYEANKGEYEKFVTTSFQFDGYEIQNYLGLVSGEVVMGTGFLSEFTAGVSDFLVQLQILLLIKWN